MKILITGATGFIGSHLCHRLAESGHTLIALSRDEASARSRVPQVSEVFHWDPLASPPPPGAFEGVEAVINLVGENIAGLWTPDKKKRISESRILGTRNLVDGIAQLGSRPEVLISASAIGYYGDRGEEDLTENSSPGSGFFSDLCVAWENEAAVAQSLGLRAVRLRTGTVLGPGGGFLKAMLPVFKLGLGGPLGSGDQWWSWVHISDVAGIIDYALRRTELDGPVNVTSPRLLHQKEFAHALGRLLGRPSFLRVPRLALKLTMGELSEGLLASSRVLPGKAQETGYRFQFPELESALPDVLGLPA